MSWSGPGSESGPETTYKVYFSRFGDPASITWTLLTNVSGTVDTVRLYGPYTGGMFTVATSNYWGEALPLGQATFPAVQPVTLAWDYEADPDPDLQFKLYHSQNPSLPMPQWEVLTNVPGTLRAVTIQVAPGFHLFSLTATNSLGESDFSPPAQTPPLPSNPTFVRLTPLQ